MVNLCFQDNAFMLNLNLNFTVFARSWAIHPVVVVLEAIGC